MIQSWLVVVSCLLLSGCLAQQLQPGTFLRDTILGGLSPNEPGASLVLRDASNATFRVSAGVTLTLQNAWIDISTANITWSVQQWGDNLLLPSLVQLAPTASLILNGITIKTTCQHIIDITNQACRQLSMSQLGMMQIQSHDIVVGSWSGTKVNATDVRFTCQEMGQSFMSVSSNTTLIEMANTTAVLSRTEDAVKCAVAQAHNWTELLTATAVLQSYAARLYIVLPEDVTTGLGNIGDIPIYTEVTVFARPDIEGGVNLNFGFINRKATWTLTDTARLTFFGISFLTLPLGPYEKFPWSAIGWPMWMVNLDRCQDTQQVFVINCTLVMPPETMDYMSHWTAEVSSPFPDRAAAASWYTVDNTCNPPIALPYLLDKVRLLSQRLWLTENTTGFGIRFIRSVFTDTLPPGARVTVAPLLLTTLFNDPYKPLTNISWVQEASQLLNELAFGTSDSIMFVRNITLDPDAWNAYPGGVVNVSTDRSITIAGWPSRQTFLDFQRAPNKILLGSKLTLRNIGLMNGAQRVPAMGGSWMLNLTLLQWSFQFDRVDSLLEMQSVQIVLPPLEFSSLLSVEKVKFVSPNATVAVGSTTGTGFSGAFWGTIVMHGPSAASVGLLIDEGMVGYNVTLVSQPPDSQLPFPNVNITGGVRPGTSRAQDTGASSSTAWIIVLATVIPILVLVLLGSAAALLMCSRRPKPPQPTTTPADKEQQLDQMHKLKTSGLWFPDGGPGRKDGDGSPDSSESPGGGATASSMSSGMVQVAIGDGEMDDPTQGLRLAGHSNGHRSHDHGSNRSHDHCSNSSSQDSQGLPHLLYAHGDVGLGHQQADAAPGHAGPCNRPYSTTAEGPGGRMLSAAAHGPGNRSASTAVQRPENRPGSATRTFSPTPLKPSSRALSTTAPSSRLGRQVANGQHAAAASSSQVSMTPLQAPQIRMLDGLSFGPGPVDIKHPGSNRLLNEGSPSGGLMGTSTPDRAWGLSHRPTGSPGHAICQGGDDSMDSFDLVPEHNEQLLINCFDLSKNLQASMAEPDVASQLRSMVSTMQSELGDQEVEVTRVIGQGGGGVVYQGTWRGLTVAVKTLVFTVVPMQPMSRKQHRAMNEAAICKTLQHPNIVATYAYGLHALSAEPNGKNCVSVSMTGGSEFKLFIIQEFCDGGTLKAAIEEGRLHDLSSGTPRPVMAHILQLATDIAAGMSHVHSRNVVHGDLTPANVLLQPSSSTKSHYVAKVADFGLSWKLAQGQAHVSNARQGTSFYIAPEVLHVGIMSKAADTFSFGLILHEMYHGIPFWRTRTQSAATAALCRPGMEQLTWSPKCPPDYKALVCACLDSDPQARPSFFHVVEQLLAMQRQLWAQGMAIEDVTTTQLPTDQTDTSSGSGNCFSHGHSQKLLSWQPTSGLLQEGDVKAMYQSMRISSTSQPGAWAAQEVVAVPEMQV